MAHAAGVSLRKGAAAESKQDNNRVVKSSEVEENIFAGAADEAFSATV